MARYLAAVDRPDLMSRLEDIGITRNDPIKKTNGRFNPRAAWVKTNKGSFILNRKITASLVVQLDETTSSLALVSAGQKRIIVGHVGEQRHPCRATNVLSPGMHVETIRTLPEAIFTFQAKDKIVKTVSLNTATHVWGLSRGKHVQLATVLLGETLTIESFSSSCVKKRFMDWGMEPGITLQLKRIFPATPKTLYLKIEGPAYEILISQANANYIYVRACNICWSCGACMTSCE